MCAWQRHDSFLLHYEWKSRISQQCALPVVQAHFVPTPRSNSGFVLHKTLLIPPPLPVQLICKGILKFNLKVNTDNKDLKSWVLLRTFRAISNCFILLACVLSYAAGKMAVVLTRKWLQQQRLEALYNITRLCRWKWVEQVRDAWGSHILCRLLYHLWSSQRLCRDQRRACRLAAIVKLFIIAFGLWSSL